MTIFLEHLYRCLGQKIFFDFLSKILSCTSSWCNQPPPIWNAQFFIPSGIGLTNRQVYIIIHNQFYIVKLPVLSHYVPYLSFTRALTKASSDQVQLSAFNGKKVAFIQNLSSEKRANSKTQD